MVSVLFLAGWLIHLARTSGIHRPDLRRHTRQLVRHGAVTADAYGVTFGIAVGVPALIRSI